jgi:alpha-glucosidase
VANAYLHDASLTDNPPVPMEQRTPHSWAHAPNLQFHYHDSNLVEEIDVLDEIRRTVDAHPNRFVMGEFSEEPERCGCFASSDKGLHSGYSFPLLEARKLERGFILDHFAMLARHEGHWPSVAFCNHDIMRTRTRFGGKDAPMALAKMMFALLLSLKGTALIYQGEELGLPQADVRRDQLRDPVGDLYYPYTFGRDGCRTPMPWDASKPNLGFGTGTPWLPVSPLHKPLAVSEQESDGRSMLAYARAFIAGRKKSEALTLGEIELLDAPAPLLSFTRTHGSERVLCVFNMSREIAVFTGETGTALPLGSGETMISAGRLDLAPYAVYLAAL